MDGVMEGRKDGGMNPFLPGAGIRGLRVTSAPPPDRAPLLPRASARHTAWHGTRTVTQWLAFIRALWAPGTVLGASHV